MSEGVAAGQLRSFVERIERLDSEIKDLNADKASVYQEAKSCGFDMKAMREVIRVRRMEDYKRIEHEEIVGLYREALGMDHATRARAKAPKHGLATAADGTKHDAETGEVIEEPKQAGASMVELAAALGAAAGVDATLKVIRECREPAAPAFEGSALGDPGDIPAFLDRRH